MENVRSVVSFYLTKEQTRAKHRWRSTSKTPRTQKFARHCRSAPNFLCSHILTPFGNKPLLHPLRVQRRGDTQSFGSVGCTSRPLDGGTRWVSCCFSSNVASPHRHQCPGDVFAIALRDSHNVTVWLRTSDRAPSNLHIDTTKYCDEMTTRFSLSVVTQSEYWRDQSQDVITDTLCKDRRQKHSNPNCLLSVFYFLCWVKENGASSCAGCSRVPYFFIGQLVFLCEHTKMANHVRNDI